LIVREVGEPNVRFQYDAYHMQRMEGQLTEGLTRNIEWIGHVQIADVPGRHEPGTGEINYPNVARALAEMGYRGPICLEAFASGNAIGREGIDLQLAFIYEWISAVGQGIARGWPLEECLARISFADRCPVDIGQDEMMEYIQRTNIIKLYNYIRK